MSDLTTPTIPTSRESDSPASSFGATDKLACGGILAKSDWAQIVKGFWWQELFSLGPILFMNT